MRAILLLAVVLGPVLAGCMRPASAPAASVPEPASGTTPVPAGNAQTSSVPRFKVIGTEPFWGIDVDGERLHFTTMEDQAGSVLEAAPDPMGNGRWRWAGEGEGGPFALEIAPADCNDGMSDRRYAYAVNFRIGTKAYRGCADDPATWSGKREQP